jgi:hypothetical protein
LAAAGRLLLDDVETEYRAESQPPVVRQAAEWFVRFTRGRYELRLAESEAGGEPSFRALDTTQQRGLALAELSRGTRMQLLLAVRLAFALDAERGTSLPILLDEVLSSSDPERFAAIADCVLALVEQGRQVFYFTSQPSDGAAWKEIASRRGVVLPAAIDLAALRKIPCEEPTLLSTVTVSGEPVPAPEGRAIDDYASVLGVPPLQPAHGSAGAHLAHLIDDPEALYRLLCASIETYGQLEAMAAYGPIDAWIDDRALERVRVTARITDAFAEGWQIGRGRPLTREALVDAGVTDRFINEVCSLAEDLDWDARRLIDALDAREDERAKGFRAKAIERMTEHLTTSGYLDPRPTLDKAALCARVLGAANEDLRQGVLGPDEVAARFERLWQLAEDSRNRE